MNLPPFPGQDLAKLVLGYLAEEQLMTAYDEFLSASPYLDAMKNEYDRIFMTSLKSILAEYRAVKIYVETCRPFALRRRLIGFTNMLDLVKFLIQNVDVNKFSSADNSRQSFDNRSVSEKKNICAVCTSLNMSGCACKSRQDVPDAGTVEVNPLESAVETTSLDDLPGNHTSQPTTARKKQMKTLSKGAQMSISDLSSGTTSDATSEGFSPPFHPPPPNDSQSVNTNHNLNSNATAGVNVSERVNSTMHMTHQMKQIDVIRTNGDSVVQERVDQTVISQRLTSAGTFQDVSCGVQGEEAASTNVPDSSTTESNTIQTLSKGSSLTVVSKSEAQHHNPQPLSKAHIFLTVGTIKPQGDQIEENVNKKSAEQKVTILSDIKVDKYPNDSPKMPQVLKNTSTPLMEMQTIFINGNPVYKQQPQLTNSKRKFTKDEIMAMPTIIVVPTSGPPRRVPLLEALPRNRDQQCTEPTSSNNSSSAPSIEPLVIDLPDSPVADTVSKNPVLDESENRTEMLVKTVDHKNVSAPKDSTELSNKTTPQVMPLLRKSSSTPRRTSHVRVLDFTTPRRILQEPISENSGENNPIDVVVSKSPSLHTLANDDNIIDVEKTTQTENSENVSCGLTKENVRKLVPPKKKNWDADLRALAIPNQNEDIPIQPRCRVRPNTVKKAKQNDKKGNDKKNNNKSNNAVNDIQKKKTPKARRKTEDVIEDEQVIIVEDSDSVPLKPNINVMLASEWIALQENEKMETEKANTDKEDLTDTPEMDRVSLQNVICSKLNISDLLETPYKQALYDIQMETPRLMGPDLPGDPMSDIKIMNIPTPRFLDTPKPVQATPSAQSYSSRPTDYSSGGSYYKPDDQDYIPPDLGYPTTSPKVQNDTSITATSTKKTKTNSKRPVRKCTKNVSYVNSPFNKHKENDDKAEEASTSSETVGINIEKKRTTPKPAKPKAKRLSINRKNKTPVKKDTPKPFMKIKPRRVTPTKNNALGKSSKRKSDTQKRKRTSSKDKNAVVTPHVCSPTKSRRKSSTPRKINCTKRVHSESSGHESPETTTNSIEKGEPRLVIQDSESENIPLMWSDDGSQDDKFKEPIKEKPLVNTETDDILKIKEYIASELRNTIEKENLSCNLHIDLVKRGFDTETAKSIERDLLDTPPRQKECNSPNVTTEVILPNQVSKDDKTLEKTLESDASSSLKVQEEDDDEEIEFTVSECHEESENFISCCHDEKRSIDPKPVQKLKDKFCMEVCIDDDVSIRLRATPFSIVLDQDPKDADYDQREIEMAVSSISHMYTPMKESMRAQVYEIFDSTLTSLDTPLKATSPQRKECNTTVTEVVLEVEEITETRKRKRGTSEGSEDSIGSNKRTRPETQYLLNSANIQNIDIESVLSKLHGP